MSQFTGIFKYEYSMSIKRAGLWIAYGIVFAFFGVALFAPNHAGPTEVFGANPPWQEAGETVYLFNMLLPLIGGILSADRMQRDFRLGLRELQASAPLPGAVYLLGKYFGVLLSTLTPLLAWVMLVGGYAVVTRQTSAYILAGISTAFLAISVPSFVFVVAFSLACPLIMPVRVFQILFTGYWFWGNFLNDRVFPTISGSLLNSSGIYAEQGFFDGTISQSTEALHTPLEAWLNILVLTLCAGMALFTLDRYLSWQRRKA
jgi:ABC-2 type transport system permease protein